VRPRSSAAAALLVCVGCASAASPHAASEHDALQRTDYPGQCSLLKIEETEQRGDTDADHLLLVATYQPSSGAPIGWSFRIERQREKDLRAHLASHPTVTCRGPEPGLGHDQPQVVMPPFEGQAGEPAPEAPIALPPPAPATDEAAPTTPPAPH